MGTSSIADASYPPDCVRMTEEETDHSTFLLQVDSASLPLYHMVAVFGMCNTE